MRLDRLDYKVFPTRDPEAAAVIEWGNSAVISALDADVATFGPQTSRAAYFEVEVSPVLASPIDGGGIDMELNNADEVEGNMLIMTNALGLSGVQMAQIATKAGAAALCIVNTNGSNSEYIYRLEPQNEEEAAYAEEHIDIPVVMISLSSANLLTSANIEVDEATNEIVAVHNNGLPERVRLYAGGDRPFFEDLSVEKPVAYLIHNLLTPEECDELIATSEDKLEKYDGEANFLEGTAELPKGSVKGIDRTYLWKGILKGPEAKAVDERFEQVTAFPQDHMSDFQISKYHQHAYHRPHFDYLPDNNAGQVATFYIFLNDDYEGGEVVFHSADPPIKIKPRKGLAIVHHNHNEGGDVDSSTMHAELAVGSGVKWAAKKWVYTGSVPTARRVVLPILTLPFGGKAPSFLIKLHNVFVEKFGAERGGFFFDKFITFVPIFTILNIISAIWTALNAPSTNKKKSSKNDDKKKRRKKND